MKTSELTGCALAYAVGVADNRRIRFGVGGSLEVRGRTEDGEELSDDWDVWMLWYPQASWSQAGPIIERENISVTATGFPWWQCEDGWYAHHGNDLYAYGDTPLIAAMRAFVASKLGDEVEIPEELK